MNKRTPFILIIILLLAAGGGAGWYFWGRTAQAKTTTKVAAASTATVQRGSISLSASGSGTLVTNQSVNMSFSTSGRVAELNVKLGDMVKAGDVLARLDKAADLEANLAAAQANLLQAKQALTTLQKGGGSALAKAYQTLATAQAAYNDALVANQRAQMGRCSPEIASMYQTALEAASQKLNDLIQQDPNSEARTVAGYDYDTALANYTYCTSTSASDQTKAQSNLEVAKVALQEAQDAYDTLKSASGIDPETLSENETRVEIAQTAVDNAQEDLDGITLTAPIDGKITALSASVGTIVDTATFLTISDVSHPAVTVSLDETDMDKLVVGYAATVTFTALPGKTFTGKVSVANPQMVSFGPFTAASGQIALDSDTAKALENLPLGLSATITITGKQAQDVLTVPVAALKHLSDGTYAINLVGSDGKTTRQAVTIGIEDKTTAEITSGLKEGDIVSYTTTSTSSGSSQEGGMFMPGGDGRP